MRIPIVIALLLVAFVSATHAEVVPPFELNMDRVEVNRKGAFAESKTYCIPTVYLRITAKNTTSARNKGASAKARIFVEGLEKALLQDLAKKVQDDLVTKVRAAGFTVLTYDDLKSELAGADRMKPNPKFGFPTKAFGLGIPIDFAIVAPSDEQTIDWGSGWPHGPYKTIAKGKSVVVLVPEIYFNFPEVLAKKDSDIWGKSIALSVLPTMKLFSAMIWGLPPSLGGCDIRVKEHGGRLAAQVVGSIRKVSEEKNLYGGEWSQNTGDFEFLVDPVALSTGILRVGYAVNDLTVKTLKGAHH